MEEAEELKKEGNDNFRGDRWAEALAAYRMGLGKVPKRQTLKGKQKASEPDDGSDTKEEGVRHTEEVVQAQDNSHQEFSSLIQECGKVRSILYANIAACHVKLVSGHIYKFW